MSADQPLVGPWGSRSGEYLVSAYADLPTVRDWAAELGGTVVPLIAADRLTDRDLWAAVRETARVDTGSGESRPVRGADVTAVLAALRAHLESEAPETQESPPTSR